MIEYLAMNETEDAYCISFESKTEADEWLKNQHEKGWSLEYHIVRRERESQREASDRLIREGLTSDRAAVKAIRELAELYYITEPNAESEA